MLPIETGAASSATAPSPVLPIGAVPPAPVQPHPSVVDGAGISAVGTLPTAALQGAETQTSAALSPPLATALELPGVRLYQARLIHAAGGPIADETCLFFNRKGEILGERRTDRDGRVSLADFALPKPSLTGRAEKPSLFSLPESAILVLPDVLEGFDESIQPSFPWGKNRGQRDDGRRFDPTFHLVPANLPAVEIQIGALTEEQKLQYVRWFYAGQNAIYTGGTVARFDGVRKRWLWPRPGLSCNAHVNFFLGFWFNYNQFFPAAASGTETRYLPMLDSSSRPFQYGAETRRDRGYAEFVEAVAPDGAQGFSRSFAARDPRGTVSYLRMSRFFTWSDTGNPQLNAAGDELVRALGDFNVYSVSDCNTDARRAVAVEVGRWWVKQHRADQDFGFSGADYTATVTERAQNGRTTRKTVPLSQLTDKQVDGLEERILQKVLWHLDENARASDRALLDLLYERGPQRNYPPALITAVTALLDRNIRQARDPAPWRRLRDQLQQESHVTLIELDHHGGIVMPRGAGGVPREQGTGVELWKFSADGTVRNRLPIILRRYTPAPGDFLHLALWRLKPLRPGGYAPDDAATRAQEQRAGGRGQEADGVDVDAPPRFLVAS
jgi:hypothetical protein